MSEKITCPRRVENYGPGRAEQGRDGYGSRHGLIGQNRGCTYRGSMHPDDFMQAIRDGKELGVTDKDYKAYVDGMKGKFYFQHLSKEQRHEFVGLLNEGKVRLGFPGHFTVLPYFVKRGNA